MAALPPEFRALLQSVIEQYERYVAVLEAEMRAFKKMSQNSSLAPSSRLACATKCKIEAEAWWASGTCQV